MRKLDLSARPWDNGYNFPSEPDDPVEDHPYLFIRLYFGNDFHMTELENMTGGKSSYLPHPSAHPVLINEYGWLWLNRDGTPTEITRKIYEKYLGQKATPEQRFELGAYFLAGLTEYWRAHRNAAGVLYFVYLTGSYPGAYTSDNFHDVEKLELEPHFADFVREAFKPLGLYINFWQNKIERGERRRYAVMMVNDYPHDVRGKLTLELVDQAGGQVSRAETDFALGALGAGTYSLGLDGPATGGVLPSAGDGVGGARDEHRADCLPPESAGRVTVDGGGNDFEKARGQATDAEVHAGGSGRQSGCRRPGHCW